MARKPQDDRDEEQLRRFEALKKRHDQLEREKVRLDAQIEAQERELAQLRADAEERFGTSDPARLEEMLAEMERANEERLRQFEVNLVTVERSLRDLAEEGRGDGNDAGAPDR